MEVFLGILVFIVLISAICSEFFNFSIFDKLLIKIPIVRKISDFFEDHPWLLIPLCLFIVFPLLFYCGYRVSDKPNTLIDGRYYRIEEYGHTNPAYINTKLKGQIQLNDSLFSTKTANQDSIVFDRINNRLIHTAKKEFPANNYSRYEGKNAIQILLLGAIVIPTWAEVKSCADFASFSKKSWGICLLAAGYLGFHQGYKSKQIILMNESWSKWLTLQDKLHDERWWKEFANKYPYYYNDSVIAEGHFLEAGIGITLGISNNVLSVESVEPNGPAYRAGILKGDTIISADGELFEISDSTTNLDIILKLRGRKDSQIRLGVLRDNDTPIEEFILTRDVMPMSCTLYLLTNDLPMNVIDY